MLPSALARRARQRRCQREGRCVWGSRCPSQRLSHLAPPHHRRRAWRERARSAAATMSAPPAKRHRSEVNGGGGTNEREPGDPPHARSAQPCAARRHAHGVLLLRAEHSGQPNSFSSLLRRPWALWVPRAACSATGGGSSSAGRPAASSAAGTKEQAMDASEAEPRTFRAPEPARLAPRSRTASDLNQPARAVPCKCPAQTLSSCLFLPHALTHFFFSAALLFAAPSQVLRRRPRAALLARLGGLQARPLALPARQRARRAWAAGVPSRWGADGAPGPSGRQRVARRARPRPPCSSSPPGRSAAHAGSSRRPRRRPRRRRRPHRQGKSASVAHAGRLRRRVVWRRRRPKRPSAWRTCRRQAAGLSSAAVGRWSCR